METVLKARLAMEPKPDPFAVINGGLREGDEIVIDWIDGERLSLVGCQVEAFRGDIRLSWASGGCLRDQAGKCLYAPYLTCLRSVCKFANMLAGATGYELGMLQDTGRLHRFALKACDGPSRRLFHGDCMLFDWKGKSLRVERRQGTIDMNLYRPDTTDGLIHECSIDYISMSHHPTVLARVMAEANGLLVQALGGDKFLVVTRS